MVNLHIKQFILLLFVLASSGIAHSQTPQPAFTLIDNESGTIKNYLARDYVDLKTNFHFTATPGYSFDAKINALLVFPLATNPIPGSTTTVPGDTIPHPGDTFTSDPSKSVPGPVTINQKTIGGISKSDTSFVIPLLWFKTVAVSSNLNGYYKWKDVSANKTSLLKYDSRGAGNGVEYTLTRDKIRTYNFNPAIDLSYETISKEILIKNSNLSQATVIGVWGPKAEELKTDKFIFAINGRQNESVLFSKGTVYPGDSTNTKLTFGSATTKNLLWQSSGIDSSLTKFHERSLRVETYYKANKPNTSIWNEPQKAVITVGNKFQKADINNTSTFSNTLNNFAGFTGFTPELLVFDRILSPKECSIFESYLAIKYGLSLDKSYVSASGKVIWDFTANSTYNNRITGYGREDRTGLNQKMATTSYEEAPYYSEQTTNDSYDLGDTYNLSSRNRLLVMGCQPANPLNDGDYILFGDNNDSIKIKNTSIPGFGGALSRKWLVNTNRKPTKVADKLLTLSMSGLTTSNADTFKITISKSPSQSTGTAVTSIPLKGVNGQLAWTVGTLAGPVTVKFGTNNPSPIANKNDYGYQISNDGQVYGIFQGVVNASSTLTVLPGQRVEVEKVGGTVYLRVNGIRYKNSELIINSQADLISNYYGSILIGSNTQTITMTNIRSGGFVDTGNRIELSYYPQRASDMANYKNGNAYLIIDRTGSGNFMNAESYLSDETDTTRSKIIFNNVFWDTDGNGKDAFTFGFKNTTQNKLKKDTDPVVPQSTIENANLSVYYKDLKDLSTVTVKLLLTKPSISTVYMYDLMGRLIYKRDMPSSDQEQYLDIRLPNTGVYIIKVITNEGELSKKVISKIR